MWNCLRTLVVLAFLFGGCQRQKLYDQNDSNAQTRHILAEWGLEVSAVSEAQFEGKRVDLTQYKTAEQFCSKWINKDDRKLMERDIWGRPFGWSVRTEGERTIVRVSSWGRNGINENGEGDDLYVEVTILKGREPQTLLKDEKGEIHLLSRP
jgi:hypothetical protein